MRLHYAGKFNGDMESLPKREHEKDAVAFKEPEDPKKLSLVANGGSLLLAVLLSIPYVMVAKNYINVNNSLMISVAGLLSLLILIPHEFLHAICFKEDVYLYMHLNKGMLFVVGNENMTKARFIFMSLLPNLVFGLTPYILYFFFPGIIGLGVFGIIAISCGFGDYMNVFNALTQMPKGAMTYLCGMHSYWFMPEKNK